MGHFATILFSPAQTGLTVRLESAARITSVLFPLFEITAIVLGALGGALSVRRERRTPYDFLGVLGLGLLSGVGGGVIRDVLLGDGPPIALQRPEYLAYALLGAGGALLFGRSVGPRVMQLMLLVDALALAFFTVAGSTRAENAGLGFLPCLLLGITTAVGGGSLRDIFTGHPPRVFQAGQLYAIVSAVTALLFLGGQRIGVTAGHAATVATVLGFVLRLLVLRFDWSTRRVAHLSDPAV